MSNRFWVNSNYINELTVLFAWLTALIPWNIQYVTLPDIGNMIFVRFPFFQIRYQLGFEAGEQNLVLTPYGAYNYQAGNPMADPYLWWLIAAIPLAIIVIYAVLAYFLDGHETYDITTLPPVPFPRIVGVLLGIGAVFLTVATLQLMTTGFQGLNIPLGILFLGLFSYILLTNPVSENA